MPAKAKCWAKYNIGFLSAWFIIHVGYLLYDGNRNTGRAIVTDVAVVLGNTVNPDGKPSARLKARLDEALALIQSGKTKNIIVSGGHGREGFFEADKMRDYLISQGIPRAKIIVDNKGDNTLKTAVNTKAICADSGYKSITVVSQWYHITRTKLFFKNSGLAIYSASPNYYEWWDLYGVPREFVAYYWYLL